MATNHAPSLFPFSPNRCSHNRFSLCHARFPLFQTRSSVLSAFGSMSRRAKKRKDKVLVVNQIRIVLSSCGLLPFLSPIHSFIRFQDLRRFVSLAKDGEESEEEENRVQRQVEGLVTKDVSYLERGRKGKKNGAKERNKRRTLSLFFLTNRSNLSLYPGKYGRGGRG